MKPLRKTTSLRRRLLTNYLMFGLLSITALGAGIWFLLMSSADPTDGQDLQSRLITTVDAITESYAANNGQDTQELVNALARQDDILFCAVVSNDGKYAAHSNEKMAGRNCPRPVSVNTANGVIERISHLHADNTSLHEYRVPLRRNDVTYGVLQVGVPERDVQNWPGVLRRNAATVVVLPLLLLLLGGGKLIGVVKSTAAVERQLSLLASDSPETPARLRPVEASTSAAVGWNRLVEQSGQGQILNGLERRLSEVLGGFREDKSERILQSLTDGVAVTNEIGHITFANRAFSVLLKNDSRATDWILEELVHSRLPGNEDQFRRQLREPSRPGVVELLRSSEPADGVFRLARFPLRSKDGQTLNHVWSLRDVTQQKLAEQTRDQFINAASDELRTPLVSIKASANTLLHDETIGDEQTQHHLTTIDTEATRLGRFVDEFLNISRMEAGSLALNRHDTDFRRMVSDVVARVRPQLDAKRIDFQALVPPKVPEVSLDKDRVSAALVNLLRNAVGYTPEGGRVSLKVELVKATIRIQVEDSGIGISSDDLPRVFNKFFRSDDERVRDLVGTGLGLSFAQEVVRLHGGKITAQSELNNGSRFTVTLPLS